MKKSRITFTFSETTIKELRDISDKTMIPQARIAEKAIVEAIKKLKESQ